MLKWILGVAVFLAVPSFALAGTPPSPADRAAAVKQCSTERNEMKTAAFNLLYGTNANGANAFGKCVSTVARQNAQARSAAAAECRTERHDDPAAFATQYGKGHDGFAKCLAAKAEAATTEQEQATVNAAKACWAERQPDPAAFAAKYGKNANKANAFGKCVSSKVKHSSP